MGAWSILFAVVGVLGLAIGIEAWVKRGRTPRTLAEKFHEPRAHDPDKPALGMEEIDMDVILQSERANRSAAALGARDLGFWSKRKTYTQIHSDNAVDALKRRNKETKK